MDEENVPAEGKRVKTQPIPKVTEINVNGSLLPEGFEPQQVIAIIPAYNEERFIGSVVLKTLPYAREVIVVDDGSTDGTGKLAALAGALVMRHETNQGKGRAINTGLEAAVQYQPGAVVMLDADGQHCIEDLPRVAAPVLQGEADLVIGSRYLQNSSKVPRSRIWGHWFFNRLTGWASGADSTDSQSGFRAFSPTALECLHFRSQGFSVESEMQFLAHEHGLRLREVEITIRYDDKPKRPVLAHGLSVLNGILYLVGQYRPLLYLGVPGSLLLLSGVLLGIRVVNRFNQIGQLATGTALVGVMFAIFGLLLLSTGFMLHSIRGLLKNLLRPNEHPKA